MSRLAVLTKKLLLIAVKKLVSACLLKKEISETGKVVRDVAKKPVIKV
jgi:hypothetical protein